MVFRILNTVVRFDTVCSDIFANNVCLKGSYGGGGAIWGGIFSAVTNKLLLSLQVTIKSIGCFWSLDKKNLLFVRKKRVISVELFLCL